MPTTRALNSQATAAPSSGNGFPMTALKKPEHGKGEYVSDFEPDAHTAKHPFTTPKYEQYQEPGAPDDDAGRREQYHALDRSRGIPASATDSATSCEGQFRQKRLMTHASGGESDIVYEARLDLVLKGELI